MYENFQNELKNLLKNYMKKNECSVNGLEEITGVDHSQIYRFFHRKRSFNLKSICKILDSLGYKLVIVPKE